MLGLLSLGWSLNFGKDLHFPDLPLPGIRWTPLPRQLQSHASSNPTPTLQTHTSSNPTPANRPTRLTMASGPDASVGMPSNSAPNTQHPQQPSRPLPAVFESLDDASDSVLAAVEWVLMHHAEVSQAMGQSHSSSFVRMQLVARWGNCTLPSPLVTNRSLQGVTADDLYCLLRRVSKRDGNTNASHHRAPLMAAVMKRRSALLERFAVATNAAFADAYFTEDKAMVDWFSVEYESEASMSQSEAEEEDGDSRVKKRKEWHRWLARKKGEWRSSGAYGPDYERLKHSEKRASRRRARHTDGADISAIPAAVPWMIPHPQNGQAWLSDESVAAFRHLRAEALVSGRKMPVSFTILYSLMFGEVPPAELIPTRQQIRLGMQRLHERDVRDLTLRVEQILEAHPEALMYDLVDDSPVERGTKAHAHYKSIFDPEKGTPVFILLSLKGTADETADGNAEENLLNSSMMNTPLVMQRYGGGTVDHKAIPELKATASKLAEKLNVHESEFPCFALGDEWCVCVLSHSCTRLTDVAARQPQALARE